MIPKTIHYCWFGRNPLPKLAEKCIASWKKYCPDYEIIQWNEDNFDLASMPLYVRQAYEAKKWAYVTDYVRLQVIYDHGGIYMDTDVELRKPPDELLAYSAYFGFEAGMYVATGLGFGAEKGTPILRELMADYQDISFIKEDGSFDDINCPVRNLPVFLRHGLLQNDERQLLDGNILILPSVCLCPGGYAPQFEKIPDEAISVHWYAGSWKTAKQRRQKTVHYFVSYLCGLVVSFLIWLLGEPRYRKFREALRR